MISRLSLPATRKVLFRPRFRTTGVRVKRCGGVAGAVTGSTHRCLFERRGPREKRGGVPFRSQA